MREHAEALAQWLDKGAFSDEWTNLPGADKARIAADFKDAGESEGIGAQEYRRRIGVGNLEAYARVMAVQKRKA